jgi:hypothetical protein
MDLGGVIAAICAFSVVCLGSVALLAFVVLRLAGRSVGSIIGDITGGNEKNCRLHLCAVNNASHLSVVVVASMKHYNATPSKVGNNLPNRVALSVVSLTHQHRMLLPILVRVWVKLTLICVVCVGVVPVARSVVMVMRFTTMKWGMLAMLWISSVKLASKLKWFASMPQQRF